MKLTKFCMLPWRFMQVHAGGMMQCCPVAPDTDLGDLLLDYCDKVHNNEPFDPFNSEGLQAVREGILTGNLRTMCRNCFFVKNELITTKEFEQRLKEYLMERRPEMDLETADLRKVYAYSWMAISFTNRCNLSCIYCVQSVHKESNPYFKMEFPYEDAESTLDYFASQGITRFSTCVEGEATVYKHWYELFSKFHEKYPDIKLRMTTNLNRKYTDKEVELLLKYTLLDVSIDTLDPELYSKLRVNGKLEVLLDNLKKIDEKVKELNVKRPFITLHVVLSSLSWRSLEEIAEFAFENGYSIEIGNYEERINTIAYQKKILRPVSQLAAEEQKEIHAIIEKISNKAAQIGVRCGIQGELFDTIEKQIEKNYNYFEPYDDNPIFKQFYKQHPIGKEDQFLNIIYDVDNISHEGITLRPHAKLELKELEALESVTVREIHLYKDGCVSSRYGQNVMLRYRKKILLKNGTFEYESVYSNDDIETILLEICEFKYCGDKEGE